MEMTPEASPNTNKQGPPWRPREVATLRASGALIIALSAAIVFVQFRLPLLAYGTGDEPRMLVGWFELWGPSRLVYERVLLLLPLVGATLLTVAALGRMFFVRSAFGQPSVGLGFAAVFFLALGVTRWAGFQWARMLDPGPTAVHVQPALYFPIAGVIVWCIAHYVCRMVEPSTHPSNPPADSLLIAVPAVALLLSALVPVARIPAWGGGSVWLDELTMALLASQDSGEFLDVPARFSLARGFLWGSLIIAVVRRRLQRLRWRPTWQLDRLARGGALGAWFGAAAVVVWALAGLSAFRGGASAVPNPFLVLPAVVGVVWLLHGWVVARRRNLDA